ncbi:hypothetical protein AT746_08885 [Lacimicrobium alkaliphilum]|uniref:Uncharacterized protein n=1 Tax=Lacimicrobium alkaliphilum TaxID=1526571 RepID=A0A0U2JIU8_9ALTE|nr:hypothetical protein AT746_08885 [Lacimicrobium alkaliphilum]
MIYSCLIKSDILFPFKRAKVLPCTSAPVIIEVRPCYQVLPHGPGSALIPQRSGITRRWVPAKNRGNDSFCHARVLLSGIQQPLNNDMCHLSVFFSFISA